MSKKKKALGVLFFSTPLLYIFFAIWAFWTPHGSEKKQIADPFIKKAIGVIEPLAIASNLDTQKVLLGQRLFHNPALSPDNSVSCASCHNPKTGGADNKAKSIGPNGTPTRFNTPTIFNVAYNIAQFWDGRTRTLEDLIAIAPEHYTGELGWGWPQIMTHLENDETYQQEFKSVYKSSVTIEVVKDALLQYILSLVTAHSRFDKYLDGQADALNEQEKSGYELFKNYGCISCHQGRNVGGNLFQKYGIIIPYFSEKDKKKTINLGRFNVTRDLRDENVFKVPSLRNVALTGPYYHDGEGETLEQAIAEMAYYQLGRALSVKEVADIAAFLGTLTSEVAR